MSNQRTAMITGAAMGMGAIKAQKLAQAGWKVFAGVLPGVDASELGEHENIVVVEQDVSNKASVQKSAKIVKKHVSDNGLNLLINNAGIANIGTGVLEGASIEDGQKLFEINTWGGLRAVQFFLPMLRAAAPDARIINFASGAVRANPVGSGIYSMSKHAVIGMTRTLRHELRPLGIQVTSVEPGAVKTNMTANAQESTKSIWKNVSKKLNDVYGKYHLEGTTEILPQQIANGNDPNDVADQVLGLLDKKSWKPSYMVGKDVAMMAPMTKLLPETIFEKILQSHSKIPKYDGSS